MATNIVNTSTGQTGYQVPGAAPPAGWTSTAAPSTPTQVANAVGKSVGYGSGGSTNPHDAPGYDPNLDPSSTAYGKSSSNPVTPPVTPPANVPPGQTPPINTNQPSPTTVNATPYTSPEAPQALTDAVANASKQVDDLKQKYTQAHSDLTNSGVQAPNTAGSANAGVKTALDSQPYPQPSYDPTKANQILADDTAHNQYLKDYAASLSSNNVTESFVNQYKDLSNQLGIPAIDSKLMNIQAMIDGTEQNIRDEVTAAGGFATNSQVQALAVARNKTSIEQQKILETTRTNLENNLTTMIGLTEQDQAHARQQITDQLNYDQKQIEYADKNVTNGQQALKDMVSTEGWSGVYNAAIASGDPQAVSRINSLMGNGFNLTDVAANDLKTQKAKTALDNATLGIQKSQLGIQAEQLKILKDQENSGVPNPSQANAPGFNAQGVKYTTTSAQSEVTNQLKADGVLGSRNLIPPAQYNQYKAWWIEQGLKNSDFDDIFGGQMDTSKKTQYNHP